MRPGVANRPPIVASRDRRLVTGIMASLGGKAIGLAAALLTVPVTFHYLGVQRYGLWMAVTSLTSMALFADLGLGNGLLTRLSRCYATGDWRSAARDTASAYAMLVLVAAVLMLLLIAAVLVVPWSDLFAVDDPVLAGETATVVAVCLGAFLINIPLTLVQRIQYSQQQVAQSNLWQAAGSLLSLGLAIVGVMAKADHTTVIAGTVLAVPAMNLANSVFYFSVQRPDLIPRWINLDRAAAGDLVRLGLRFFFLSMLTSIAINIDGLLVARNLGLDAAAHYAVLLRLFGALSLFVTLVCLPLWPANAEALARGEAAWVRRSTRRMSMVSAGVVATGGLLLVVFGARIVAVWLPSADPGFASPPLLGALGLSCLLVASASPAFMVQNSLGLLDVQFVGWAVFLVVSVILKIAFMARWGLTGVPAGNCVAYLVVLVPAAWIGYQRSLATTIRREHRAELSEGGQLVRP